MVNIILLSLIHIYRHKERAPVFFCHVWDSLCQEFWTIWLLHTWIVKRMITGEYYFKQAWGETGTIVVYLCSGAGVVGTLCICPVCVVIKLGLRAVKRRRLQADLRKQGQITIAGRHKDVESMNWPLCPVVSKQRMVFVNCPKMDILKSFEPSSWSSRKRGQCKAKGLCGHDSTTKNWHLFSRAFRLWLISATRWSQRGLILFCFFLHRSFHSLLLSGLIDFFSSLISTALEDLKWAVNFLCMSWIEFLVCCPTPSKSLPKNELVIVQVIVTVITNMTCFFFNLMANSPLTPVRSYDSSPPPPPPTFAKMFGYCVLWCKLRISPSPLGRGAHTHAT